MLMPWRVCKFVWQVLMFGWKPQNVWFAESCQKIHSVTRLITSIKKEKSKKMEILTMFFFRFETRPTLPLAQQSSLGSQ